MQLPILLFRRLTACAALIALTIGPFSSCSHRSNEDFARDDYFGGHGNLRSPNAYVPDEVQRVDPWLPLF